MNNIEHAGSNKVARRSRQRVNPLTLVYKWLKELIENGLTNQLDARFKKSGEFDRLRRELLTQFQNGVRVSLYFIVGILEEIK